MLTMTEYMEGKAMANSNAKDSVVVIVVASFFC